MDIGTGTGGVSPLLVDLFEERLLVDLEEDVLVEAAAAVTAASTAMSGATRLRTVVIDLSTAAAQDRAALGPLDVAYSVMALHHVADVPRLLHNVADLLRPGGRRVIADLEPDGGLYHADSPSFEGHHGFRQDQLVDWVEAAGLRLDDYRTAYVDPKPVAGTVRHLPIFVATATRSVESR